ncbi:MAG: hypothetical protein J6K88_01325 [Oscillospiraceae bacterium]|nr:hypothetical protein [Oscillospiraceae bacterium]
MKREDAYYFKILLMSGFSDGYDQWLNGYLETEDPLSDIVLELSFCGSDLDKTISCLHNYCMKQSFDENAVCDRLRLFLKEAYHSKRLSKAETISCMYRFANSHGDPGDFDNRLWDDMFYMDYYHSLAKDGIIPWDRFDFAFSSYLDDGITIDSGVIWNLKKQTKKSFFSKIISLFNKK